MDSHPDTFTAALLTGRTPAEALLENTFHKIPMSQLQSWAKKHTTAEDKIVLEASGNSFQVVRTLAAIGRQALVLESAQMGRLKEAHANNDKISAVRIGKAYLAGTAKEVWVPDQLSQERRDWMHAHRKAVKRTTQLENRIQSYLSDNGVRQPQGVSSDGLESLRPANAWSPRQWSVLEGLFLELGHAEQQRVHWVSVMAREVLEDPILLSLTRLCGIRDITAFALGAVIGDIHRFSEPKKLVKYFGLNPAFDDSGENNWSGGIGGHGRKDVRALVIESAHAILRSGHPLAKWGKKLLARKGEIKLTVAAVARRLVVAVWYLLMGRETPVQEIDERMARKVGKIISHVGSKGLQTMGQTRSELRTKTYESLKTGRIYQLDPNKTMSPKETPTQAEPGATQASRKAPPAPIQAHAACRPRNKELPVSACGAKKKTPQKTEREGDGSKDSLFSLSNRSSFRAKILRPAASEQKRKK